MKPALRHVLLLWIYLLLVWGVYRYFTRFPEPVDEYIFKPLFWLIPIFYLVRFIEKRSITTIGWSRDNFFENLYLGWGLGAFFAFAGIMANAAKYRGVVFVPLGMGIFPIFEMILISLTTGLVEETVFRGYILTRLDKVYNSEIKANILSALLFTVIHLPITLLVVKPDLPTLITYHVMIFAIGVGNGIVFSQKKNIIAPTLAHALWNITILLFR